MAVQDWMKPGYAPRRSSKIITVDTKNRKIEAMLKDATIVQVAVFDSPGLFIWPKAGEYWTIHQYNGIWVLNNRIEPNYDGQQISDLSPGEAKIDSDAIKTVSGRTVVSVDETIATDGQTIVYSGGNWVPSDYSGGGSLGNTILNGNVDPANTIGSNGDFYINTVTNTLFGPKASGTWPSGTALIGPTGLTGDAGVVQTIAPVSGSPITVTNGSSANPTLDISIGNGLSIGSSSLFINTSVVATISDTQALTNKTYNGLTITTSTGTFTVANSKTLSANNSLTLAGTDGTTMTFPGTSATIARTDSAQSFTGTQTMSSLSISAQASDLSMNSNKITSLTDPTSAQDAATKNYVDSLTPSGTPGFYTIPNGGSAATTITMTSGTAYAIRFTCPSYIVAAKALFNVTAANTGGLVDVSIFDASGTTRLATGQVSTATTGVKTATFGSTITLRPGVTYLLNMWASGSVTTTVTAHTPTYAWLGTTLSTAQAWSLSGQFFNPSSLSGGASAATGPIAAISP